MSLAGEGAVWDGGTLNPPHVVIEGEAARAAVDPDILARAEGPIVVVEFPIPLLSTPKEMEKWVDDKGIEGEAARRGVNLYGKDRRDVRPEDDISWEEELLRAQDVFTGEPVIDPSEAVVLTVEKPEASSNTEASAKEPIAPIRFKGMRPTAEERAVADAVLRQHNKRRK
jgi:hypothetical protein